MSSELEQTPGAHRPYPEVPSQPDFPALEAETLAYWERERIFRASVEGRPEGENGSNEYVFYDGPPFANGLPHYGHLVTSYIKDIVPRYQTLRGRRVERRFGWDCHGLPAEMEAEKELGVAGRAAILEYGIERFNDHCRTSVLKYTREFEKTITRAARWVDFENDYKTLDPSYMESVMWGVSELWRRGLLYEGYRVMPYSWAAQTPLSNFETRMDDSYRERQDPALTVRFELIPDGDGQPTDLLAWTTTPWTLPSNLCLAVGPDVEYAVLELGGRRVILAEATVPKYESELADARRVGTVRGRELAGRRYRPLFPYFEATENAFRVLEADFVDTEEGTGVVHLAPGFGEDDMAVCEAAGVPVVCPVDDAGRFTSEVSDWEGQNVLEANPAIIRHLKERGAVVRHETILHNYPHCWRTDTPLIYRALNSWYVKVTAFRDRMVELNQEINWVPNHIRDGLFGKWLEGARDWSISRNRFWGSPIPVWKSDDPAYPRIDVYGSLDELERDFGVRPADLHRPAIDELVRPNPDDPTGKSQMRRVADVLDCWFESGSMFYAQVHYPFEQREWFDAHFPADFITEYTPQTRGWFYTMHVLATALFDRPPFRNCLCHGIILAEDGKKLSKRLRNYPDPQDVFDTIGSDALRWFLVNSPLMKGGELRIDREGKVVRDAVRLVIIPIWNAYSFFTLYANSDRVRARFRTDATGPLDRYVLAKTRQLIEDVQADLDELELSSACNRVSAFIDALNNWYIRRSRDRVWRAERDQDKLDFYDTLYSVLVTLCQLASPLLPLVSEVIYRGLSDERSVHLSDWPAADRFPSDRELVSSMDRARAACSAALALRGAHNVRVRQPLARLTVAGPGSERLRAHAGLIADEVNVKAVELSEEIDRYAHQRLQVNARAVGPRLGGRTKEVIAASKRGDWAFVPGGVEVAGERLEAGEYELRLEPRDGVACEALPGGDAIVVLDLDLDEALLQEGKTRDVVRAVQQARKEAGLHVSDRIRLALELPGDWKQAVTAHRDYLSEQTLAQELDLSGPPREDGFFLHEAELGGETIRIALCRMSS
ncbi:MAG: isoleucine--tRNA ligase [Proteobacteria bacterium]|nr:isoleucine--tRNA ligase [Pseudomonadota bacterium]